ncbi:MAG: cellobiose phosphorylase, partial [Elusimicrobiota bacterium]|nr:cellobiose phosphorylase [Elusimicrobiota bacterium]
MCIDEKVSYSLDYQKNFVIENYNYSKSLANFFPGIAGRTGIPLWTYYVNRGQGVCSMGVKNKDHQIMEFLSFNKAVQVVESQGFRTFLKKSDGGIWEPFRKIGASVRQKMYISSHKLIIEDTDEAGELKIRVRYFQLPGEKIPALIRKVEIKNISGKDIKTELADGLARMLPYGVDRRGVNVIPRHIEGLMKVYDRGGIPLYRLKINPEDKPEIERLAGNNFYFTLDARNNEILKDSYLADPYTLFKNTKNYDYPYNFKEKSVSNLLSGKEIRKNRTPTAFTAMTKEIKAGESLEFYSVIGYAPEVKLFDEFVERSASESYFIKKEKELAGIIGEVKDNILTVSEDDRFNEYARQTFMDNVLRGGMPVVFETAEGKEAFYLYSRQNGDLERDYHDFVIEPTYYSQGNGHYRCIIQNRRMDNFFVPEIKDANIRFFLNAMQTDGYNPIEVRSTTYTISDREGFNNWLEKN